jgi:hypothetical protein
MLLPSVSIAVVSLSLVHWNLSVMTKFPFPYCKAPLTWWPFAHRARLALSDTDDEVLFPCWTHRFVLGACATE